jgi:hypothetical protein
MPLVPAKRIDLGHVYHVTYPKCDENSERGIRYAHARGWSIDIDMQKDQNGAPMADHWQDLIGKDGWYDPTGKLHAGHFLNQMNPQQWGRLTTKHHDKLLTMEQALNLCGQLHVKSRIEPKAGNGWTVADAQYLFNVAKNARAVVVVATLDNDPNWRQRLHNFRVAGFPDCRRIIYTP